MTTKPLKVLFLDIDGVLNSSRTAVACKGYPLELDGYHRAMFDDVAVGLIRGLCAKGGVSVVVSSAWRITHHWDAIGRALDLPTMDRTPLLLGTRGDEIQHWLDAHPEVTQYAIVDDDSDMLPSQHFNFVKTDGRNGLMWDDFTKLCAIFGIAAHDCAPTRIREGNTNKLIWEDA